MTEPSDPAFPFDDKWDGLSKREYFAAMALQGFIANPAWLTPDLQAAIEAKGESFASLSVAVADELIDALNKAASPDESKEARE
jgi:hypothetical protein